LSSSGELVARLKAVVAKLEELAKTRSALASVVEDYRRILGDLESAKPPSILTRELLGAYYTLLRELEEVEKAVAAGTYTTDDLSVLLSEFKSSLANYAKLLKSLYRREEVALSMPVIAAAVSFIFNSAVYYTLAGNPLLAGFQALLAATVLASLTLREKSYVYVYAVAALAGLASTLATLYWGAGSVYDYYTVLLSLAVVFFAVVNAHAYRIMKSQSYRNRVQNLLDSLKQLAQSRSSGSGEDELLVAKLEEQAREIYRKLYGEQGDKLLSYKLNLLRMHGYSRVDALKKIIEASGYQPAGSSAGSQP